jgi:hypothetical protein
MAVPVEQLGFLTLPSKLVSATTAVDVGAFTGLSALALARGLAPGGRVITCDAIDRWAGILNYYELSVPLLRRGGLNAGRQARATQETTPQLNRQSVSSCRDHARGVRSPGD